MTAVGLGLPVSLGVTRWDPALAGRTWSLAAAFGGRPVVVAHLGLVLAAVGIVAGAVALVRVGLPWCPSAASTAPGAASFRRAPGRVR